MTSNAPTYTSTPCPNCQQSGTVLHYSCDNRNYCTNCKTEWEPETHE
jgi:hypothetical protein